MSAPCKDCKDRHLNCHSSCDKYKAYKKKLASTNYLIRKKKREENEYYRMIEGGNQ